MEVAMEFSGNSHRKVMVEEVVVWCTGVRGREIEGCVCICVERKRRNKGEPLTSRPRGRDIYKICVVQTWEEVGHVWASKILIKWFDAFIGLLFIWNNLFMNYKTMIVIYSPFLLQEEALLWSTAE